LQWARFMGYGEDLRLWLRLTLVRLVGLSDDKGLVLGRVRFPGWQMSGRVGANVTDLSARVISTYNYKILLLGIPPFANGVRDPSYRVGVRGKG